MMSTKFSALTPPCNRPHPPHEPHPTSELLREEVYPPADKPAISPAGKPPSSKGRGILAIAQDSPPPVGGERGGGSKRTLASKVGIATQGLGEGSEKIFSFFVEMKSLNGYK
jgi:hypothetical protein